MTVRSGILGTTTLDDRDCLIFLLDYDCYKDEAIDTNDVGRYLRSFHTSIEKQFLTDVKEPYIKFMSDGKWQ